MFMKTKKRSKMTKAKARIKGATTKARKKIARGIAPKRKRRQPKTLTERVKATAQDAIDAMTGK